jgi:hypothetical protein
VSENERIGRVAWYTPLGSKEHDIIWLNFKQIMTLSR